MGQQKPLLQTAGLDHELGAKCDSSRLGLCASGCVVQCRICNREVACSNLGLGYFTQRSTQPSIPQGRQMSTNYSWKGKGRYGSFRLQMNVWVCRKQLKSLEKVPYLSASAVVFYYEEALYHHYITFTFKKRHRPPKTGNASSYWTCH